MINYFDNNDEYLYSILKNKQKVLECYGRVTGHDDRNILLLSFINDLLSKFEGELTRENMNDLDAVLSSILNGFYLSEHILINVPCYSYQFNLTESGVNLITENSEQETTQGNKATKPIHSCR